VNHNNTPRYHTDLCDGGVFNKKLATKLSPETAFDILTIQRDPQTE